MPHPSGHPTAPPPCTMPQWEPSPQSQGSTPWRLLVPRQNPVLSWCHPAHSSSMYMTCCTRELQTRCHAQGTCVGCGAWDTPPAPGCHGAMLHPRHGTQHGRPVGCREAWTSRRKPGSARQGAGGSRCSPKAWACAELGVFSRPERHVPSIRAHAAGRGEACRGTSQGGVRGALVQPSKGY